MFAQVIFKATLFREPDPYFLPLGVLWSRQLCSSQCHLGPPRQAFQSLDEFAFTPICFLFGSVRFDIIILVRKVLCLGSAQGRLLKAYLFMYC